MPLNRQGGRVRALWVDRERHLGGLADALDEAVEADRTDWPAALGNEDVGIFEVVAAFKVIEGEAEVVPRLPTPQAPKRAS